MPSEPPTHPEENGLVIRPSTGLVSLPEDGSPALSEIISRSLAHIQTSKALGMLHRIGEHELYGPDYRLVCALAQERRLTPEEVLNALQDWTTVYDEDGPWYGPPGAELENGRFIRIDFPFEHLPGTYFPEIDGLMIKALSCKFLGVAKIPLLPSLENLNCAFNKLTNLNLSSVPNLIDLNCCENQLIQLILSDVPNLTKLHCDRNQLSQLDLSEVPNLTTLVCYQNQLSELKLSDIPNLTTLYCSRNQLSQLDFSAVPNLTTLDCSRNQLSQLDLSGVPNLTTLYCCENQLTELDIRNLRNLKTLDYDKDKTRLIQRPDQNF